MNVRVKLKTFPSRAESCQDTFVPTEAEHAEMYREFSAMPTVIVNGESFRPSVWDSHTGWVFFKSANQSFATTRNTP